jgi:hypothetical protein
MNLYLLFEKHQAYTDPPRCLGYVRAKTLELASKRLRRPIIGKHHNCHGCEFTCNDNQWLVWGTGGYNVVWLELVPKAQKR